MAAFQEAKRMVARVWGREDWYPADGNVSYATLMEIRTEGLL